MDKWDLDYDQYIEIAPGVYWVGFWDQEAGLHCNPYLIVDGDEAVLIDSGSRDDFSTVMLKIMRTGTSFKKIKRLIYHHYDPDLCGNIPHVEALVGGRDLEIISHYENNTFIAYYSARSPRRCIEEMDYTFTFASGRELKFIRTPHAHAPGSFMTYDAQTKTLFSSDLFGSYDYNWSLYTHIGVPCKDSTTPVSICPHTQEPCQLQGMVEFHQRTMPSQKALRYALDRVEELDIALIAPQHGSLLDTPISREIAIRRLREIEVLGLHYALSGGTL